MLILQLIKINNIKNTFHIAPKSRYFDQSNNILINSDIFNNIIVHSDGNSIAVYDIASYFYCKLFYYCVTSKSITMYLCRTELKFANGFCSIVSGFRISEIDCQTFNVINIVLKIKDK